MALGKSHQVALNRFLQLERRYERDPDKWILYKEGIEEYFKLGQITPAVSSERSTVSTSKTSCRVESCVFPHHAVYKEDSLTTKQRIVFDASAKTSNGRSLNDVLSVGPTLQNDLPAVLLNWRQYRHVFTADIQRMYRCIDVLPDDTVVRQLAEDERENYPLAEEVLKHEIYVDDILSGDHTISAAQNKSLQIQNALKSANMELRKWSTKLILKAHLHSENDRKHLGWDDPVPSSIANKWKKFRVNLEDISKIRIPRSVRYMPDFSHDIQLHAFCDGSTHAYAAAAYMRIPQPDSSFYTTLITAKSKISPTKPITIPRTELCGAVLAIKLTKWVVANNRWKNAQISVTYWTDATIVLQWIIGDVTRWKTFVANRVAYILDHSDSNQWRHVPTADNPADCATRGLSPPEISIFDLWWHGPSWLRQHSKLVIQNSHQATLHGGAHLTLAHTRYKFWIPNGRQAVFRASPSIGSQLMGDLPVHRVNPPNRPFIATGVDYTGAIEIKAARLRGTSTYKGYIAIFVCLTTKAVHLEAVTGLSSEHFLLAFSRFTGRRGPVQHMYSDNGTNFVGANKLLASAQQADRDHATCPTWHFTPPFSSNFGGLWEAGVKSVKHHLKRTVGSHKQSYEELATVLIRIEACLNSRPLCPLTADPDDLEALTPAHFLISDTLLAPAHCRPQNSSFREQFLSHQNLIRQFWTQWSRDWLSHLQTRPKWCQEKENFKINELVLMKDDQLPPSQCRYEYKGI
ncbi:uncharacterized protein [Drosophila suzukii]|uniref:Integrase catalytic domain-containing protein n=1 Tax=Drosophila suzukii TaxID=28584 RepID=A0ABM4TND8_DROSZ